MQRFIHYMTSLSLLVVVLTACEKTTVSSGDGRQLSILKPSDQTLKRGESNQVSVKIERKNFRDPVTVAFDQLPSGVVVTDKDKKISAEETSAVFTLRAEATAPPVAEHRVVVVAKTPVEETREYFRITVKE